MITKYGIDFSSETIRFKVILEEDDFKREAFVILWRKDIRAVARHESKILIVLPSGDEFTLDERSDTSAANSVRYIVDWAFTGRLPGD